MSAPICAQTADSELTALIAAALEKKLDSHPVWRALLHQTAEKFQIRDTEFLLNGEHFSSHDELLATLRQQFGPRSGTEMRCKFPARYIWLSQQMGLAAEPLANCAALSEYLDKVPADSINLVFASENPSQASSMMGHVFLKLSGNNREGQLRQHAVTFYTDANTVNFPKLLFQNLSTGMPGWYSVLPYDDMLSQYTTAENRNVWDYEIRMDAWTRRLLHLHLFELRDVKFKYYFHSFNCATLIDEFITVVQAQYGESQPADSLWITPKDVVKRAHSLGLVGKTQMTPAQTWLVRSIEKQLSVAQISTVKQWANEPTSPASSLDPVDREDVAHRILSWHLSSAYNQFLYLDQRIGSGLWSERQKQLAKRRPEAAYALDVPENAQPQNAPGDSQFSLGYTRRNGLIYATASYLPASHTLLDDSTQSLGPSALTLFQGTVFKAIDSEQIFIDQFVLYASQTLLPRSPLVGGVSRSLRLAYEMQYSQDSVGRHATHVSTSWGISQGLGKDVLAYADAEIGTGFAGQSLYLEARPGIGMIINELWGMKTHIALRKHHNPLGLGGSLTQVELTHKWHLSRDTSLEFDWASAQGNQANTQVTTSTWRWKTIF